MSQEQTQKGPANALTIAELRAVLTGGSVEPAAAPEQQKHKRRKMSVAGRKAIAEAQRKRWAASKKAAEGSASEAPSKPKRKLSAAGRKAIIGRHGKSGGQPNGPKLRRRRRISQR